TSLTLCLAAFFVAALAVADTPRSSEDRIAQAQATLDRLRADRLIDELTPGDTDSEKAHNLSPGNATTGTHKQRPFRVSKDGPFSYQLAVYPAYPMHLGATYSGTDTGKRTFDILIDSTLLVTQQLTGHKPGRFFEVETPIPPALTRGKKTITVTLKPHDNNTAGRLFNLATLKRPTPAQQRRIDQAQAILNKQKGNITYKLVGDPDSWPPEIRKKITNSMDFAVDLYNQHTYLSKQIRVTYNPKIKTADGNINGSIRFGHAFSKRTALHEISHTLGIGTHRKWKQMLKDGAWTGPRANALVKQFNGPKAVIRGDRSHFWPYGMNYAKEDGAENYVRHVLIVQALCQDMGLLPDHQSPPA
ncbi:MAG: hypothetical protein MI802_23605, partial [Desulfobacterales bacterium]|nr:hypothetical protein [Desulfobacterales bacterium]